MNVIKLISSCIQALFLSIGIFLATSESAIANSIFISPIGEKITSELDSVSAFLKSKSAWILGGYKEMEDGNNDPYVTIMPIDGTPAKYWRLNDGYVSQLFERKDDSYVLLSTGKVLKIDMTGISLADFQLKPNSLLITYEPDLIACTKIGWSKLSSVNLASCYRVDGTWDVDLYWTRMDIPPKMCGDKLSVLVSTDKQRRWEVIVLDPKTGHQLSSRQVDKPDIAAPICKL